MALRRMRNRGVDAMSALVQERARLSVRCPLCGKTSSIRSELIGQPGLCIKCGQPFIPTREFIVADVPAIEPWIGSPSTARSLADAPRRSSMANGRTSLAAASGRSASGDTRDASSKPPASKGRGSPATVIPQENSATLVLWEGLQWAMWGGIGGLVIGVLALLMGAGSGWSGKLGLLFYVPLFIAAFTGGLRWGLTAGEDGGREAMDWLLWILALPVVVGEFMVCMMMGQRFMGISRSFVWLFRVFYGYISAAVAGLPYALWVLTTKRIGVGSFGYLACVAVGAMPCFFGLGLLLILLIGRIPDDFRHPPARGTNVVSTSSPQVVGQLPAGNGKEEKPSSTSGGATPEIPGGQRPESGERQTPQPRTPGPEVSLETGSLTAATADAVPPNRDAVDGPNSQPFAPPDASDSQRVANPEMRPESWPGHGPGEPAPEQVVVQPTERNRLIILATATELQATLDRLPQQSVIWMQLAKAEVETSERAQIKAWVEQGGVLWMNTDFARSDPTEDRDFGFRLLRVREDQSDGSAVVLGNTIGQPTHPILAGLGTEVMYDLSPDQLLISEPLDGRKRIPSDTMLLLGWLPQAGKTTIQAVCGLRRYGRGLLIFRPRKIQPDEAARRFDRNLSSYSLTVAQPPPVPTMRNWTDATGRFRTDAKFLGVLDHQVYLEKPDGSTNRVPMDKLSHEDRAFVESASEKDRVVP